MKIFGIMTVKNEADIVAHTLQAAAQWCDAIYVLDNGSDDGTWGLIKEIARKNPIVVAHDQSLEPFTEGIRALLFNAYRERAVDGDWWCRLDADEIYVESPRHFLSRISSCDVVWAIHLQYYFTDKDLERYNRDPSLYDSSLSPMQRFRYYRADASEARFFRHRKGLRWDQRDAWPRHLGRVCSQRILVRHYKSRSPSQIQTRLKTRSVVFDRGGFAGEHWRNTDLKSLIPTSDDLEYDLADGTFKIVDSIVPRHRDPLWKAAAKSFMHRFGFWP